MGRFIALLLIIMLLPTLVLFTALIKISRNGPVFYNQYRYGKNKVPFLIYKLRSMLKESDPHTLTETNDKRTTKIGRFLRRYKLDELPQLWNIVKGDMNWLGPRPEQPYFSMKILQGDESLNSIYLVRPGLASLGVVSYGYVTTVEELKRRAKLDKYYLQHKCARLNLYILVRAILIACRGTGR